MMSVVHMRRILILDQAIDYGGQIQEYLSAEFADSCFVNVKSADAVFEADKFDLVIIDHQSGFSDQIQVVLDIKSHRPLCPVIMLVDAQAEDDALRAMDAGLDYYLIKSPDLPRRLSYVVKAALRTVDEINQIYALDCPHTKHSDYSRFTIADKHDLASAECVRNILLDFLKLHEASADLKTLVKTMIQSIKDWFECDCVGIRLRDGQDYTYYETQGYSNDFLMTENSLCQRDESGALVCEDNGDVKLECMCGNIIMGRFDPSKPYFTEIGSFWTNNTAELVEGCTPDDILLTNIRGRCLEAYESLALIRFQIGGTCIGLLHLADKRKGCFSPNSISLLEKIALIVTQTIYLKLADEELWLAKQTIDCAADSIYWVNSDGQIIYVNAAAVRNMGYTQNEFLKMSIPDINPNYSIERWQALWNELKLSGSLNFETTHMGKSGNIIPIHVSAVYMQLDGREFVYAYVCDITERKKVEEALRLSEEKFSKAFFLSPDAVNINRLSDGCFLDINQGFTEITGYSRDDVIGRSSLPGGAGLWVNAEDRALLLKRLSASDEVVGLEAEFRRKDGSVIIGLMSARMIDIENETCIVSITRDITKRKKAEQALKISNGRLQVLSRKLVNSQEIERRLIARELHDEIGATLTALSIVLEIGSQTAEDQALNHIRDAQAMTSDLMSRVQVMSMNLRSPMLDDIGLLSALHRYIENYSSHTNIQISFEHSDWEGRLAADLETCIFRVVQEGLTNIARHAEVSEASVIIYHDNEQIVLQIIDKGKGFDVKSIARSASSYGLMGMSERVLALNGKFKIVSDSGIGTHIIVTAPIQHLEARNDFNSNFR